MPQASIAPRFSSLFLRLVAQSPLLGTVKAAQHLLVRVYKSMKNDMYPGRDVAFG